MSNILPSETHNRGTPDEQYDLSVVYYLFDCTLCARNTDDTRGIRVYRYDDGNVKGDNVGLGKFDFPSYRPDGSVRVVNRK